MILISEQARYPWAQVGGGRDLILVSLFESLHNYTHFTGVTCGAPQKSVW